MQESDLKSCVTLPVKEMAARASGLWTMDNGLQTKKKKNNRFRYFRRYPPNMASDNSRKGKNQKGKSKNRQSFDAILILRRNFHPP